MFCYAVKIVYIFITIFCLLSLFLLSPFSIGQSRARIFTARLMMSSARRSKDNEMAVSTQASVELENMPFCGMLTARGHTAGATRTSVYFGILLYTPRHASPSPPMCFLLSSTLAANAVLCCAVPCLVSTCLCSSALNPNPETKASLHGQSFLSLQVFVP